MDDTDPVKFVEENPEEEESEEDGEADGDDQPIRGRIPTTCGGGALQVGWVRTILISYERLEILRSAFILSACPRSRTWKESITLHKMFSKLNILRGIRNIQKILGKTKNISKENRLILINIFIDHFDRLHCQHRILWKEILQ